MPKRGIDFIRDVVAWLELQGVNKDSVIGLPLLEKAMTLTVAMYGRTQQNYIEQMMKLGILLPVEGKRGKEWRIDFDEYARLII